LKREDPGLEMKAIAVSIEAHYGVRVSSIDFLPVGYDLNAVVYKVRSREGTDYFLKIRRGPVNEAGLFVPRALVDLGALNIVAPLSTQSGALWGPLGAASGRNIVLYPYIEGENAMDVGLTDDQWREFGTTLRAVHDSGLADRFRGRVPVGTFGLPSAAVVRRVVRSVSEGEFKPAAADFAAFWRANHGRIRRMLARAESVGRGLQAKSWEYALCHTDIHAANILVGGDGQIHLIDWDAPLIAPIERDLLFVVGSNIARVVELKEQALFFEGYGPVAIDPEALVYYRYERIIEDIGEIGNRLLLESGLGEPALAEEEALVEALFAPGGSVEFAEDLSALAAMGA
jgi:spectinomycin phosphotransferase